MKFAFLLLFALFLAFPAFGISSNEAVNLVVNANHFLYEAETYTPPNVPIEFEGESFWVIPLVSGSDVVTYFPVEVESGVISSSRSVNRGLFFTAENLRELQLLKNSISTNSGVEWVFTSKYETIFSEMSLQLGDEIFQLNTGQSSLEGKGFSQDFVLLKSEIKSLSEDALEISLGISAASSAESAFVSSPSNETFTAMDSAFQGVFSKISALNDAGLLYQSNVDKLKQKISVADLDAQQKQQLFSLLDVPESLKALRNYNLDAQQIKQSLDSSLSAISLRQDSLLSELDSRFAKNEVFDLMYSENAKLEKETGFLTLANAQGSILAPESRPLWKSQPKVRDLEQNFARAVKLYNEKNFADAKDYAEKALENVVEIYKEGKMEEASQPLFSQDLLFKIAAALFALLVLLFVFNKRDSIFGALSSGERKKDSF